MRLDAPTLKWICVKKKKVQKCQFQLHNSGCTSNSNGAMEQRSNGAMEQRSTQKREQREL